LIIQISNHNLVLLIIPNFDFPNPNLELCILCDWVESLWRDTYGCDQLIIRLWLSQLQFIMCAFCV